MVTVSPSSVSIEIGDLIARKSPLGWALFGVSGRNIQETRVMHVKLTSPVDLTEFRSTGAMGVKPTFCQCPQTELSKQERDEEILIRNSSEKVGKQWLIPYPWKRNPNLLPDNRVQAEKMLQATEKRLQKNQRDGRNEFCKNIDRRGT